MILSNLLTYDISENQSMNVINRSSGGVLKKSCYLGQNISRLSRFRHTTSHQEKWDNHFLQNFSPPTPFPFHQCWWVCKLNGEHAAGKILTYNIDIGERDGVSMELSLSFLREDPNKLCFIELSEPEKNYGKGKPETLSYLLENIACFRFHQRKRGT